MKARDGRKPNTRGAPGRRNPTTVTLDRTVHNQFMADLQHTIDSEVVDISRALIGRRDVNSFLDVLHFKVNYLGSQFCSKYMDETVVPGSERRDAAISKWLRMEMRNERTNERLLFEECSFGSFDSIRIKQYAREVVLRTIGSEPPPDLLDGSFTNGASTRIRRSSVALAQKYVGGIHCSREASTYLDGIRAQNPHWSGYFDTGISSIEYQDSSILFTVPKNSDIDRVAAKEPELNMFLQRASGDFIRNALRKRGINLNDQSVNRRLARKASVDRNLATLDLSSASDLISTQLVVELLPPGWFMHLDSIRVKSTQIDYLGETFVHQLHMFSSMGNGFTFELESLLFYALSLAINRALRVRGTVSVYGDDIITPRRAARMYPRVFAWFGFIVNTKKSHWTGNFRESCGGHYFHGCTVTPFFVREEISTLPQLILVLNQIRLWLRGDSLLQNFLKFWDRWSSLVPFHLRGGLELGSGLALVDGNRPRKILFPVTKSVKADQLGAYAHWLRVAERGIYLSTRFYHSTLGFREWAQCFDTFGPQTGSQVSHGLRDLNCYSLRRNRAWVPSSEEYGQSMFLVADQSYDWRNYYGRCDVNEEVLPNQ